MPTKWKHKRATVLVALVFATAFTACDWTDDNGDYTESEAFSFDITVEQQTHFRLTGVNGTIDLVGVDQGSAVRISGEKRVRANSRSDAQRGLDQLEVQLSGTSDEVRLRTDQPNFSDGRNYTVDYTIEIPADLVVDIDHINGDIDLRGTDSNVSIDLVNGEISSKLSVPDEGTVDFNMVNGTIVIEIPTSTSATLDCSLTNGTITTSNLSMTNLTSGTRSLHGTIGSGSGTISLSTVNGSIRVVGGN